MRQRNRILIGILAFGALVYLVRIPGAAAFEVSGFTFDDFDYHGHSDSDWDSGRSSGGGYNGGGSTRFIPSNPPLPTPPPPSPAEIAAEARREKASKLEDLAAKAYGDGLFQQALNYYQEAYGIYQGDGNDWRRDLMLKRMAWARASMAQQLGNEYWRHKQWRLGIASYRLALSQCGSYCDADYRNALLFNVAVAESNLEWEAGTAAWDRHDFKAAAAALARSAAASERTLAYRPGDRAQQTNLRITHGYAAWAQAKVYDYDPRGAKDSLHYLEEAHRYLPDNHDLASSLDLERLHVAGIERERQKDEAAERQFSPVAAKVQAAAAELAQSVRAGGEQTVQGPQPSAPFGIPSNPSGLKFMSPDAAPASTPTAGAQADSARKTGVAAVTTASAERAHELLACQLDRAACANGDPPPVVTASPRLSTQETVFPGLSKQDWSRLQDVGEGRELIQRADSLVEQQAKLTKTIDQIRSSTNASARQQDMIDADMKLQDVNRRIDKLQGEAQRIIDRVVLDATPAKKS
jgi:hypothetical protein